MPRKTLLRSLLVSICFGLLAPAAGAAPPVADSGPDRSGPAGTDLVLDGSASDPDGDALEIRWIRSVVSGGDLSSCTFSGPTAFAPISAAGLAPTLNCTTPGQYLLQLAAADGTATFDSLGALVTFTEPGNSPPVVDSGPDRSGPAGTDLVLDGSASDPDGDALEIRWIRSVVSGGDLSSCTFSGPTAFAPISAAGLAPTLNCTTPGQYLVQLVAGDGTTSVDDTGALVTFTAPVDDFTAPTCTIGSSGPMGATVVVADPESGIASVTARLAIWAVATPGMVTGDPTTTASIGIVVERTSSRPVGVVALVMVNGDGDRAVCLVVVPRIGQAFVV